MFRDFNSIQDLEKSIRDPEDLWAWMFHHILYIPDIKQWGKIDRWETPEEVMKNRKADCEGFAVFARKILMDMDYDARIIVTSFLKNKKRSAHAMCAFKRGEIWWLIR